MQKLPSVHLANISGRSCRTLDNTSRRPQRSATTAADETRPSPSDISWILPSTMLRRRSARAASAGSWVTTTTVRPLSAISLKIANTCSVELVSSAPVGSSATMTSGRLDSARAIATRWRWPPESWLGRLPAWSFRPRATPKAQARVRASPSRSSCLPRASAAARSATR